MSKGRAVSGQETRTTFMGFELETYQLRLVSAISCQTLLQESARVLDHNYSKPASEMPAPAPKVSKAKERKNKGLQDITQKVRAKGAL